MKELNELMKAVGALAGEIHEVTKDGLGWDDLSSLVDVANDFHLYKEGFSDLGKLKEELKNLKAEDAALVLASFLAGLEQGKK